MARSVQVIYEGAFEQAARPGSLESVSLLRLGCCGRGLLILDGEISAPLRNGPAGPVMLGLVDFVLLTLLFWWSIHFLLAGRESWSRIGPSAVATAIFWIGLGVFASFYLSSTLVSDSRLYGKIGVVFTLVTWFIAIGAVITLGAVVGAVLEKRRVPGAEPSDGAT